jgi:ribose transport system ATP-binding protein
VFISHFLDDVLAICDRITVFRNGEVTASESCATVDKRWVIDRMIGAGHDELEESYLADIPLQSRTNAEIVLRVEALTRTAGYEDVSLSVRGGEVLGIYGFLGSGQLELARTLFGRLPADTGRVALDGRPLRL